MTTYAKLATYEALGNAISAAVHNATQSGMSIEDACSVTAEVAADYLRSAYGNDGLNKLVSVVMGRGKLPPPQDESLSR